MSRQSLYGEKGQTPAPPPTVEVPPLPSVESAYVFRMPADELVRVGNFVEMVRLLRAVETKYRLTVDSQLRRRVEKLQDMVDAAAGFLAADIAATIAAAGREGGGS